MSDTVEIAVFHNGQEHGSRFTINYPMIEMAAEEMRAVDDIGPVEVKAIITLLADQLRDMIDESLPGEIEDAINDYVSMQEEA